MQAWFCRPCSLHNTHICAASCISAVISGHNITSRPVILSCSLVNTLHVEELCFQEWPTCLFWKRIVHPYEFRRGMADTRICVSRTTLSLFGHAVSTSPRNVHNAPFLSMAFEMSWALLFRTLRCSITLTWEYSSSASHEDVKRDMVLARGTCFPVYTSTWVHISVLQGIFSAASPDTGTRAYANCF